MLHLDIYKRLKAMGLELPQVPGKAGIFTLAREFSSGMVYSSGCGPDLNGEKFKRGKIGAKISLEEGQEAAKNCMLNILAVSQQQIDDLNRIKRFVKMLVFVSSSSDFLLQPKVADAASQLLIDLFGTEAGTPARSAVGVTVLPDDIPVEIEVLFELEKDAGHLGR